MRRDLALLGALFALLGVAQPVSALPPTVRSIVLGASACSSVTVSLDFANGIYCQGGSQSSSAQSIPGWSFSRASTKTAPNSAGQIISFASGVPAITDLGWLDEGASTNLALQSQAFNNAAWSQVFVTPVDNQALAPDNTLTAAKVTEDTTAASQHRIEQPVTFSAVPYTFSVYAKPNGRTWIQLRVNLSGAFFDIQNGVLGTVDSSVTASITKAANGFYRCTVTFTPSAGAAAIRTNLATANAVSTYTGDGVSGAFLWGAQLEQASALSSYIPTTSASVTRAADALSLTYAGSPATATVTYGSGSTATPSAVSPLNLGSSSGGAWVGNYVQRVVVK